MSAFAGIVTFGAALIDERAEDAVCSAVTALSKGRTVARRLGGRAFLAQRLASPAGLYDEPLISRGGRALFTALARLDNREELGAALGLALSELARTSDGALLLRMIERWGDASVARCLG